MVEIRRVMNVVDDPHLRIVFFDQLLKRELSMPLKRRPNPFQPPGAPEVLMEPGFEDFYESYGNFTSRA
jgi:hypothetical protein